MSKGSFLAFFVVSRQQVPSFLSFMGSRCQNCHMASREFLKILSSARLGDVSAQQMLASAYLTGAFKTPIQPANALIWLEKSYFSITNQELENKSSDNTEISDLLSQVANIPLVETFGSPAFGFIHYSPVRHSPPDRSPCCRSTCMCKAFRQRSI